MFYGAIHEGYNTESTIVELAKEYIKNIFKDNQDGHDLSHTLRVYNNALKIAELEGVGNIEIISLGALLHDVDDYKLFNTVNNANARAFLNKYYKNPQDIEYIIEIINSVSFSKNRGKRPRTIDGKIVQDADRIDGIGAIGIARTFLYNGKHGKGLQGAVQHFYDKLLIIKGELNTNTAKKMAEKRHKCMVNFLKELDEEIGL